MTAEMNPISTFPKLKLYFARNGRVVTTILLTERAEIDAIIRIIAE